MSERKRMPDERPSITKKLHIKCVAATDPEMACLFVVLGLADFQDTELKTSLSATLRRIVNALHKCRWDEYHGRPALVEKTHQDIAKRLRALAAKGVDIPRVKRVDYL